jgi:Tetracyclin repressor-like, C-terminal domain
VADGSIAPCDPKLAAFSIAGSLNLICRWYEPGGDRSAEEIAREFTRMLTQGIAQTNGHPKKVRNRTK